MRRWALVGLTVGVIASCGGSSPDTRSRASSAGAVSVGQTTGSGSASLPPFGSAVQARIGRPRGSS